MGDQANMIIVSDIINKYAKRELSRDMKKYNECNCLSIIKYKGEEDS